MLFVSDDDSFRSAMRAYLEDGGFQVRSCADAARVPELFFCGGGQGSSIDLLLIDVHALGATGLRLAAALTSFEPDLPVIVISAPGARKNAQNALTALAGRGWKFLDKTVLPPRLLEMVHNALDGAEGPRRLMRGPKQNMRASPATDRSSRSGSGRSVGAVARGSPRSGNPPLRLLKTQGTIQ